MGSLPSLFWRMQRSHFHFIGKSVLLNFCLNFCFHELLVKFWVKIIIIFPVQRILQLFQRFTKPLEMDNLPGAEKPERSFYVRTFCSADRSSVKSVMASPLL